MLTRIQISHRRQKISLILSVVRNPASDTLLDVGGGVGIANEFFCLLTAFRETVVVNLLAEGTNPGKSELVQANGCLLPFPDASFDWVFSNAVIEHVGGANLQTAFANEIRRVARKGYFVFTPNRYFPIDPHSLVPGFQFLSPKLQRRFAHFVPGPYRKWPNDELHLLSFRQMKALFPEANVVTAGFTVWANNLGAVFTRG